MGLRATVVALLAVSAAIGCGATNHNSGGEDGGPGGSGDAGVDGPPMNPMLCGNGVLDPGEQCDDGNTRRRRRLHGDCQHRAPATSARPPGAPCERSAVTAATASSSRATSSATTATRCPATAAPAPARSSRTTACPTPAAARARRRSCAATASSSAARRATTATPAAATAARADCSTVETGLRRARRGGGACTQLPTPMLRRRHRRPAASSATTATRSTSDGCTRRARSSRATPARRPARRARRSSVCGDGVVDLDLGETATTATRPPATAAARTCQLEPDYACPTPGAGVRARPSSAATARSPAPRPATTATRRPATAARRPARSRPAGTCPTAGHDVHRASSAATASSPATSSATTATTNGTGDGCSRDVHGRARLRVRDGSPIGLPRDRRAATASNEGFEQCDDGNLVPYDGCSPTCTIEPKCAGGTCTAVCGDGLKFPQRGVRRRQHDRRRRLQRRRAQLETGWTVHRRRPGARRRR